MAKLASATTKSSCSTAGAALGSRPQRADPSLPSRPEAQSWRTEGDSRVWIWADGQIYFRAGSFPVAWPPSTDHERMGGLLQLSWECPSIWTSSFCYALPLGGAGDHIPVIDCLMLGSGPHPRQGFWTGDTSPLMFCFLANPDLWKLWGSVTCQGVL